MKSLIITILMVVLLVSSCYAKTHKGETLNGSQVGSHEYYMEKSDEEIRSLIAKISKIQNGTSYDEIVVSIGKPTYDKQLAHKKDTNRFSIRVLDYYVKKYEKDFTNEKYDNFIRLELDKGGKLVGVKYIPSSLKEEYSKSVKTE